MSGLLKKKLFRATLALLNRGNEENIIFILHMIDAYFLPHHKNRQRDKLNRNFRADEFVLTMSGRNILSHANDLEPSSNQSQSNSMPNIIRFFYSVVTEYDVTFLFRSFFKARNCSTENLRRS